MLSRVLEGYDTKTNSLYVQAYLAIKLFLIKHCDNITTLKSFSFIMKFHILHKHSSTPE